MTQPVFHVVADGELDHAVIPVLVNHILEREYEVRFVSWKGIRGNKPNDGYSRRLRFAVLDAADRGESGIVATVDCDKSVRREKLKELQEERRTLREKGNFIPIALGEAVPHLEAWLIDEPTAVRSGMQLDKNAEVVNWRKAKYPKDDLIRLLASSPRSSERPTSVWPDIARAVDQKRMQHPKETGWQAFEADVVAELGNKSATSGTNR